MLKAAYRLHRCFRPDCDVPPRYQPCGGPTCAEALRAAIAVLLLLFELLVGIRGSADACNLLCGDRVDQLLIATVKRCVGTAMVRLSSLTTSLLVPLTGVGLIPGRQAFFGLRSVIRRAPLRCPCDGAEAAAIEYLLVLFCGLAAALAMFPGHFSTAFRRAAEPEPLRGGGMRQPALSWSLEA